MQITFEDCLDMLDMTEDEVAAIAHHNHIPMTSAVALSDRLIRQPDGLPKLALMIAEDLSEARAAGKDERIAELEAVLRHFIATHPCSAQTQKS
jgi:hypothetical protein